VGGGQTVVNSLKDGHAVTEALSGEIEAVLRLLADKLETLNHERGRYDGIPTTPTTSCLMWKSVSCGCLS
jgi:hypothetical protein